jgi:hypothetical protein
MISGSGLIGLILLSMAWLFYLVGLYLRIPILPGVIGSLAAFFSVGLLEAPWPWLWILLPLALDPYWLGKLLRKR